MNDYQDFSSWRPEQERQFVVFEKFSVESGKKAMTTGLITAGIMAVLIIAIVFSFEKPKGMDSDLEEEDTIGAERPAPAPAAVPDQPAAADPAAADPAAADPAAAAADPAAADPAAADPAAAAADPAAAAADPAAAGATTAPAPPKGATKAPPTALIGK